MTRLLLVEDEPDLARSLCQGLREEEYVVDHARDGDEALWHARSGHHDAMLLDLRLPRVPGIEVCRRLRAERSSLPILMLTACDATEEVVAGLDAGADDYMTKPFAFAELLARLRSLLRRGTTGRSACLCVDDLQLDVAARRVQRGGREIALGAMEYRLLEFLLRHEGAVQTRARIVAAVWDDETRPESNVLEVHVANLRRKLDAAGGRKLIHPRRGVGYLLAVEEP